MIEMGMTTIAHWAFGQKDPHPGSRGAADVWQALGHQESHVRNHSPVHCEVVLKGTGRCPLNAQYRP